MSLVAARRSSSCRNQSFGLSLDLLVVVAVVLAALPAALTDAALEANRDEADEVGALIQTAAEGKARASIAPDLDVIDSKEPMNFCRTGLAEGEVDADRPIPGNAGAAEVANLMLKGSPELAETLGQSASPESAESPCPILALVAAVALGTYTARSILTMQCGAGESGSQRHSVPAKVAASAPSSTSLLEATRARDAAQVAELLKLGARANTADAWGCTPLHLAASVGDAKIARLLLDSRADVDASEAWEETALHMAARAGSVEVCELLLAKGATVDSLNSGDQTPLLVAALAGHRASCEALLDHGAGVGDVGEEDLPSLLTSLIAGRCIAACLGERQ